MILGIWLGLALQLLGLVFPNSLKKEWLWDTREWAGALTKRQHHR